MKGLRKMSPWCRMWYKSTYVYTVSTLKIRQKISNSKSSGQIYRLFKKPLDLLVQQPYLLVNFSGD